MQTMYEKLMTLTVFKGIGAEQLSSILEKTHLEFASHDAGEYIKESGEDCREVTSVLSGEIETETSIAGGRSLMVCRYGAGKVFGLEYLFGMDNKYGSSLRALTRTGTMSFSKQQYMQMLSGNSICMINFLNYLSFKSQRISQYVDAICSDEFSRRLAAIVTLMSDRDCGEIRIENIRGISDSTCQAHTYEEELKKYEDTGILHMEGDTLIIPSRNDFLTFCPEPC